MHAHPDPSYVPQLLRESALIKIVLDAQPSDGFAVFERKTGKFQLVLPCAEVVTESVIPIKCEDTKLLRIGAANIGEGEEGQQRTRTASQERAYSLLFVQSIITRAYKST